MKTLNVFFKESQNNHKITAYNCNDFASKLFLICPISYIEDVEDMEDLFNNGFENSNIKIN